MAKNNTLTIIILIIGVGLLLFRQGAFEFTTFAIVPSTLVNGVCEYNPPVNILACEDLDADYNPVTGQCEITPDTVANQCPDGSMPTEDPPGTFTCFLDVNVAEVCPDGVDGNVVNGVCEVPVDEAGVCPPGVTGDVINDICQVEVETDDVCPPGVTGDVVDGVCLVEATTGFTCPDDTWDLDLNDNICKKNAPEELTCPSTEHDLVDTDNDGIKDTCQFQPDIQASGCSPDHDLVDTDNDGIKDTCQFEPETSVADCDAGTPSFDELGNPICVFFPEFTVKCEVSTHDPVDTDGDSIVDTCKFTPPIEGICNVGVFNPVTNFCEYSIASKEVCEEGATFNPNTEQCEITISSVNVTAPPVIVPTTQPEPEGFTQDPITLGIIGSTIAAVVLSRKK